MIEKTARLKITPPPPNKTTKYTKYNQNRETQRSTDKIKLHTCDIEEWTNFEKIFKDRFRPYRKNNNGWIKYTLKNETSKENEAKPFDQSV